MSDALLGSVLGLVLFNISVGDRDSGIKCSLSKFAGGTKLCEAVDSLDGRDVISHPEGLGLGRWDW